MRMSKKPVIYSVLVVLVVASLFLSSCGGAKTTPVATANVPAAATQKPAAATQPPAAATQPPAATTQPPAAGKTVATLIYTQEFDSISPLYTSMWFSWT